PHRVAPARSRRTGTSADQRGVLRTVADAARHRHRDALRTPWSRRREEFMNSEPRVSVVMAAYNAEKYLRQAVDSILSQTLADFELIVVDDASIDATRAVLESYSDPRIRALYNPSNLGQCVSRNKALAAARGKYIAILDADDIALPTRLEKQAEWLDRHPEIGLLGSYAVTIDEQGKEHARWDYSPTDDAAIKWALLFTNVFIHSSVMMRKSVVNQTGGYSNEECIRRAFVEDYELLSR